MKKLRLLFVLLLGNLVVLAQTRVVTGVVKDSKTGAPLPSVTIKVKGKNVHTVTNLDGAFTLNNVPAGDVELEISSVGYTEKTVAVSAGAPSVLIDLEASSTELSSVVVTALGITKEQRKVGYSVTQVGGDLMNKARETNVAYSLEGRVAGLNISGTSGGPGSSARILLRGVASMSASSPLFVINGIPIDNTQRGSSGEWGGADNGDGIGNLNPDDIESMTVLKGAAASALYGARAANGVILITTKSGKKGQFTVDYNMNYSVDRAVDNTDFQYVYGQGTAGAKPANATDAQNSARLSWGAKLDGSSTIQFDGNMYPYSAVKDNIHTFYRTAPTFTNTVSVSGGGETGTFRLSLSNMDNQSIVRNSGITRKTVDFNATQKLWEKVDVQVSANYIDEHDQNRPYLSDGPLNPNNGLFLANNIDESILAPGYDAANNGKEVVFSDDIYVTNPWFVVNQGVNNVDRKRLIASVSAKYNLTDWLYLQGRVGDDVIHDRYFQVNPWGLAYTTNEQGSIGQLRTAQITELNSDVFLGLNRKITPDFSLSALLGANLRKNKYEYVQIAGGPFVLPYLYSPFNVVNFSRDYGYQGKEAHSAYYTLDLGYKDFLTLSTTGRYDTYSTLPESNRSIFTPSVSASFIFSNLVNIPNLSYGKLRASFAQTSGEPVDPYITSSYYSVGSTVQGITTGSFSSSLPNLSLKPFTVSETEFGTEMKFYNNRVGIDLAYFARKTKNEIFSGGISPASGYTSQYIGTGSTQNRGIELLLTGTPVQQHDFEWTVSFNFTYVKNKILDIYGPSSTNTVFSLGTYRPLNANTAFVKGMSGPQVMAYDYVRDAGGNIVVDDQGLPLRGSLDPQGSVMPKYYGGLNNDFTYKQFRISFLIDYKYGNKILSATSFYSIYRGLNKMTLAGRESGITVDGVTQSGAKNTVPVDAQTYYQTLAQRISAIHTLDGSFVKLRQITLGYDLLTPKIPVFQSITLSLVARNLLTISKNSDNIDPEDGFSSLVRYAGIEGTSLPSTTTYGINVNFKFKK